MEEKDEERKKWDKEKEQVEEKLDVAQVKVDEYEVGSRLFWDAKVKQQITPTYVFLATFKYVGKQSWWSKTQNSRNVSKSLASSSQRKNSSEKI